jgi:zeaxanthin glucosyltransferase
VAQHLRRLGYDVGWSFPTATPAARGLFAGLGIHMPTTILDPSAAVSARSQVERLDIEILSDSAFADGVTNPLMLASIAFGQLPSTLDSRTRIRDAFVGALEAEATLVTGAIRRFGPDVAIVDSHLWGVLAALETERVRWADVSSGLYPCTPPGSEAQAKFAEEAPGYLGLPPRRLFEFLRLAEETSELFWKRRGPPCSFDLRQRCFSHASPWLNTIFSTPEFIGPLAANLPPKTFLVGPCVSLSARGDEPDFPWDRVKTDRPLIYMSSGSVLVWPVSWYKIVAKAAAALGAQLVLSLPERLASRGVGRQLEGDVLALPFVPQVQILERATAFVSHGGANSIGEAMYHGVPLLVSPITFEQPVQGYLADRAGVGIRMDAATATVEGCIQALGQLLDASGSHRSSATQMRHSYRRLDGATEAARLVAEVVEDAPHRVDARNAL